MVSNRTCGLKRSNLPSGNDIFRVLLQSGYGLSKSAIARQFKLKLQNKAVENWLVDALIHLEECGFIYGEDVEYKKQGYYRYKAMPAACHKLTNLDLLSLEHDLSSFLAKNIDKI